MDIIFWRHALVEPSTLPDLQRELSAEGHAQAAYTAGVLNSHLPQDCKIFVSPAQRAIQTANALQRPFEIDPRLAPGAKPQTLLDVAQWPNGEGTVLLVGHEPAIGLAVSMAMFGHQNGVEVKNSWAYWISQKEQDGVLKAFSKGRIIPQ
ncbi:MAG: histidine phosphatase family protein [Burkholderiales bacterium]|nr:histidine phosphatase family protein [Burkholderiales bacterium]